MGWAGCQKDVAEAVYERMDNIQGIWTHTGHQSVSKVSNIQFLEERQVTPLQGIKENAAKRKHRKQRKGDFKKFRR